MKDESLIFDLKTPVKGAHFLIVKSAYRKAVIDRLVDGVIATLKEYGVTFETIDVHGSLEIPAAIALAEDSDEDFDGYIALGCILKGETIHDEVIAYTAYQALQDMSVNRNLAIGCGILTVNTEAQAIERADPAQQNRGREAALAALQMLGIRQKYGVSVK